MHDKEHVNWTHFAKLAKSSRQTVNTHFLCSICFHDDLEILLHIISQEYESPINRQLSSGITSGFKCNTKTQLLLVSMKPSVPA